MSPGSTDRAGHVWVDGEIVGADERHLSAFDRGFQLGDGVFETLRARRGRPTELDAHLARLHRSAAGLDIALPDEKELHFFGDRSDTKRRTEVARLLGLEAVREAQTLIGEDFLATVLQHELDHLHGVVYLDRVRTEPGKTAIAFTEEYDRYRLAEREGVAGELKD